MMELLSEFIIKSEHLWSGSFWLTFFYRHFETYHNSHLTFMGDHTPMKLFQWCMFVQGRNVQRGLVSPLIPNFQDHGISSLSPLYHHHLHRGIRQRAQQSWSRFNVSVALIVTAAPNAHLGGWLREVSLHQESWHRTDKWCFKDFVAVYKYFTCFLVEFPMQLLDFVQILPNPITCLHELNQPCRRPLYPEKYIPGSILGHSCPKSKNHPKSFSDFNLIPQIHPLCQRITLYHGSAWPSLLPVMRLDPQNCTADTESSDRQQASACGEWWQYCVARYEPHGNPPTEPTVSTTPWSHYF